MKQLENEATRDAVKTTIVHFLYSEETGLPLDGYSEDEVTKKTNLVFLHVLQVYQTIPSPYYDTIGVPLVPLY